MQSLAPRRFVRDGEPSFDDLRQRIHPSAGRVRTLSRETPAVMIVFDLLVDEAGTVLSPATTDRGSAEGWFESMSGLDGVMAKRLDAAHASGERTAMQKVKRMRTATAWSAGSAGPPDRGASSDRCCSASTTTTARSTTWASRRASRRRSARRSRRTPVPT
jgi:ATP-dependent DNA ligase